MLARIAQGTLSGCGRRNAVGWQAVTQSPQKVHSPSLKSTVGKPPSPCLMMRVGQARAQSPQRVQVVVNSVSGNAHGGRNSAA